MVDRKWGNPSRALAACAVLIGVACENPAPDSLERGGGAGSAARTSFVDPRDDDSAETDAAQGELAAASARRSAHPATPACAAEAAPPDGSCGGRMSGVYGVEVSVDVEWSGEVDAGVAPFDPGRGKVTALLIAELAGLCPGEREGELVTRLCDLQLPPFFSDWTGGVVQLTVPHATWERSRMPELTTRVRATDGQEPGFEIASPMTAMLGIVLDSHDAAWPSHEDTALVTCGDDRSGADCFPDQDEDDYPGITLRAVLSGAPPSAAPKRKGGWHYIPVPSDVSFPLAGSGARALFSGLRTKLGGTYGVGADCNRGSGAAAAGDLELRVFDCAMSDGSPCTVSDATIVDRNMPVLHALGGTNRVIRLSDLGDGVSCADVREALAVEDVVRSAHDMDDR